MQLQGHFDKICKRLPGENGLKWHWVTNVAPTPILSSGFSDSIFFLIAALGDEHYDQAHLTDSESKMLRWSQRHQVV